jgi:hypothetical protein
MKILFPFFCLLIVSSVFSQGDTTKKLLPLDTLTKKAPVTPNKSIIDSVVRFHSPKKAAIRSALVPGLGQIYNKKYWKLPIVYGALGTDVAVFVFNLKTYKDLQFAYSAKLKAQPQQVPYARPDSTDFNKIRSDLKLLDVNGIRSYRNEYRKYIDYSVLVFIVLWGLNVADAAVDAHLKSFDVSPDLGFHFKFGHSQLAGTNGVSIILAFK